MLQICRFLAFEQRCGVRVPALRAPCRILAAPGKITSGEVVVSGLIQGHCGSCGIDNDDAGRKAATDVTRLFVNAGLPAPKVVTLPDGVKDINQFFGKEPT